MKIVSDEGIDKPIVDHLRALGYEVYYIFKEKSCIPDSAVLEIANKNKALLITLDTDFGELIFRLRGSSWGSII